MPLVDTVATQYAETGAVALFLVNRSTSNATPVEVDLRAFGDGSVVEAVELSNPEHTWYAAADATSVLPEAAG